MFSRLIAPLRTWCKKNLESIFMHRMSIDWDLEQGLPIRPLGLVVKRRTCNAKIKSSILLVGTWRWNRFFFSARWQRLADVYVKIVIRSPSPEYKKNKRDGHSAHLPSRQSYSYSILVYPHLPIYLSPSGKIQQAFVPSLVGTLVLHYSLVVLVPDVYPCALGGEPISPGFGPNGFQPKPHPLR